MPDIAPVAPVLPQAAPVAPAAPANAGPALGDKPAAAAPAAAAPAAPAAPAGDKNAVKPAAGDSASVGLPTPASTPSASSGSNPTDSEHQSTETSLVKNTHFSSQGDPHETTANGLHFDNEKSGDFIKYQAKSGDFELQTRQEPWPNNPQATVNTMVGVKVNGGGDKITYDAKSQQLSYNGKPITVKDGDTFQVPGGGTVTKTGDGYEVTSAKGDKVDIHQRNNYCDITGDISKDRHDGDISGELGAVSSNTDFRHDLVGRDGKELENTDELIKQWQCKDGESMFGAAPGAKPADNGAQPAAVDPNAKPGDAKPADPGAKPAAVDPNAKPGDVKPADAKPADGIQGLLGQIKELLTKLMGDPAMKDQKPALDEINKQIGQVGADGKAGQPVQDALNKQANDAKPNGNADMEKLLELIKQYIAELAKQANAAPADQAPKVPVAAPALAKA